MAAPLNNDTYPTVFVQIGENSTSDFNLTPTGR